MRLNARRQLASVARRGGTEISAGAESRAAAGPLADGPLATLEHASRDRGSRGRREAQRGAASRRTGHARSAPTEVLQQNFLKLTDRKNRGVIKGDGDNR